jgi:micrococcal nuclease
MKNRARLSFFKIFLFFLIWNFSLICSAIPTTQKKLVKVFIKKVIDGDTVVLGNGERLRYAGINTLELHTLEGIPEPFAKEAYELNKKLVEGKYLYLKLSKRRRDRYGRLLGELYFENGTSVSEILVKKGLALVCKYKGNQNLYLKYLPLQREALKKRIGIFSLIDKEPVPEFLFHGKKIRGYIGNKRSKRFHHPKCPEARFIRRKVILHTLEEAFYKGYCPARCCFNLIFPVRK